MPAARGVTTTMAVGALCLVFAAVAPAAGAKRPVPAPPQDSVTVTGSGGGLDGISAQAQSGPLGENPTGSVALTITIEGPRGPEQINLGGPVTCLDVTGHTAVFNFREQTFGLGLILTTSVTDNGGNGLDQIAGASNRSPTDCSPLLGGVPLSSGRAVVVDAPPLPTSKEQCKNGGFAEFGFPNQGQCIKSVKDQ